MIQTFIEKNRKLLKSYCLAARIIGWVLLIQGNIGVVLLALPIISIADWHISSLPYVHFMLIVILQFMFLGLLLLGVAQFLRYLFESEYHPGWILRNGTKILYVCAVILVSVHFLQYFLSLPMINNAKVSLPMIDNAEGLSLLGLLLSFASPAMAKALILIGLGRVLSRVMPIIEEHKSLV